MVPNDEVSPYYWIFFHKWDGLLVYKYESLREHIWDPIREFNKVKLSQHKQIAYGNLKKPIFKIIKENPIQTNEI